MRFTSSTSRKAAGGELLGEAAHQDARVVHEHVDRPERALVLRDEPRHVVLARARRRRPRARRPPRRPPARPRRAVRANTVTARPRAVSARATAAPMPRPPPVTMAVRAAPLTAGVLRPARGGPPASAPARPARTPGPRRASAWKRRRGGAVPREHAGARLGVGARAGPLLAAHRHAELLGLEHAGGAARADVLARARPRSGGRGPPASTSRWASASTSFTICPNPTTLPPGT